jgi:hypothetical protein
MIRTILVGMAVTVLAALLNAKTDKPEIFRNEEFGITLPIPDGALLCPVPENEHNHGPVMLLGTSVPKGCSDLEQSRSIDVFASFNAIEDTKTLAKFLKAECTEVFKRTCLPAPARLGINGMRSADGRVNHSDGWIDIIVVTQGG